MACASSIFTCFSFMYFRITSLHLRFGRPIFRCPPTYIYLLITTSPVIISFGVHPLPSSHYYVFSLPIFRCPPTSIFSLLHLQSSYLSVSTHTHLLITTSSVFLSFGVHPLPSSHYYVFSLPIFRCPPTPIFSLLRLQSSYILVSTHIHLLITTSSVFLSFSVHPHPSSHYYIFSLPIFRCPPTSIFSLLRLQSSYLSVSTHIHLLITTSSVFLSFGVHPHPSSHYYVFSLHIFRCPPTPIFSLLRLQSSYLSVSTHTHLLITTSSVFLSFSVHPHPSSHYYISSLPIFWCPPTSIFSLLHLQSSYLSVSTHTHLLITTSSVFLSFGVHPHPSSHYYVSSLPIFRCPPTSIF